MRRLAAIAAAMAAWLAALLAYRAWGIEPRAWGAICAAADPPWACAPRDALLWAQYQSVFGDAALALGLAGFVARWNWLAIAALAIGIAGVVNYDASWGMPGAALGVWTLLMAPADTARPAPGRPGSRPGTAK